MPAAPSRSAATIYRKIADHPPRVTPPPLTAAANSALVTRLSRPPRGCRVITVPSGGFKPGLCSSRG